MCSMKRIMLFGLLLTLAYGVHAKPFYSYDLHGQVNGDVSGVTTLADVDMADEFVIRLNIWERNEEGTKFRSMELLAVGLFLNSRPMPFTIGGRNDFTRWAVTLH